jgi:hypothetical protein
MGQLAAFAIPLVVGVAVYLGVPKARAVPWVIQTGLFAWAVVAASTGHSLLATAPESGRFRWSLFLLIAASAAAVLGATRRAQRMHKG